MKLLLDAIDDLDPLAKSESYQKFITEKDVFAPHELKKVHRLLKLLDKNAKIKHKVNIIIEIAPGRAPLGQIRVVVGNEHPVVPTTTTIYEASKKIEELNTLPHQDQFCSLGKVYKIRSFSARLMQENFDYELKKEGATFDVTITDPAGEQLDG